MKAYIEIGEATNKIIEWINSKEYERFRDSCIGDTKDDGFRGACFIIPSILIAKCNIIYERA